MDGRTNCECDMGQHPRFRRCYVPPDATQALTQNIATTLVDPGLRFDSGIPGLGWALRIFITRFFRGALDGLARHAFPDA